MRFPRFIHPRDSSAARGSSFNHLNLTFKVIEFVIEGYPGMSIVSHTDSIGRGIDGSANAPKAMPIRSGPNSAYQKTVEPQSGQKWNSILRPESLRRSQMWSLGAHLLLRENRC
jgi:hypothetical protein